MTDSKSKRDDTHILPGFSNHAGQKDSVFIRNESRDFHLIQMLSGVGTSLKSSVSATHDTIAKVGNAEFLFASIFRSQVVQ